MAEPATWGTLTEALDRSTRQQARIKELEEESAGGYTDARIRAEAARAGILDLERACSIAHALALAELAQAQPASGEQAEAQAIFHLMQDVRRDAKELASHVST